MANDDASTTLNLELSEAAIQRAHVYCTNRAELHRVLHVKVEAGANLIHIHGLPACLLEDTIKVSGQSEGDDSMLIGEVLVDSVIVVHDASDDDLDKKVAAMEAQVQRIKACQAVLSTYMSHASPEHSNAADFVDILKMAEEQSADLYNRLTWAERELTLLLQERNERDNVRHSKHGQKRLKINLFSQQAVAADLYITYAVLDAYWHPVYDVRVSTETLEKPVALTFKAKISQSTGELWKNIDLVLETAAPTNNLQPPTLYPQQLAIIRPVQQSSSMFGSPAPLAPTSAAMPRASLFGAPAPAPAPGANTFSRKADAIIPQATVTQTGTAATYCIPGKQSITAAGVAHTITIAELQMDAELEHVIVPRVSKLIYLRATVKNTSSYFLLHGQSSVYVDGSFVANSSIALVAPQETFKCNLGTSQSIKVTQHPVNREANTSGGVFGNKSRNTFFGHRYTIASTARKVIEKVRVYDQVPVSTDAKIEVNLREPQLPPIDDIDSSKAASPIKITRNVACRWAADPEDGDSDNQQGIKMGKFMWLVCMEPSDKVSLELQYEVVHPSHERLSGLLGL